MGSLKANWSYPTEIRFGAGRIRELAHACREKEIRRPLLVTDPGLAGLPMIKETLASLDTEGLAPILFKEIRPNPLAANVVAGIEVFRQGERDGVIAVGGGSALDAGKVIAFMVGQTRPMWDFEDVDDWWKRAHPLGIAPVIAVPTTAGTGSEVGRAGVITDAETQTKKVIFHPMMLPVCVIADPTLTVSLPARMTVGTGMDALAHCLEAYCSPSYHPMSQGIAVEGIRLVRENLEAAFRDGTDLLARANMMTAAAMGAVAFQKGLGAIHALSHPVGALYDTHHGMTNAVFMPYVLVFNRNAIEERIARLAVYLGLGAGGFDGFLDYVLELRRKLQVPHTLEAFGVDDSRFDLISRMALEDPTAAGNPVPLTLQGVRALLEKSAMGDLQGLAEKVS